MSGSFASEEEGEKNGPNSSKKIKKQDVFSLPVNTKTSVLVLVFSHYTTLCQVISFGVTFKKKKEKKKKKL